MATKFKTIEVGRLRAYEFYDLHTEVKNGFGTRQAYFPASVRNHYAQTYVPAYNRLDEGVQKIVKSALTAEIQDADRERDETYAGMVNAKNSALTHFDPAKREAARRLDVLFDTYGNLSKMALYAETAGIENFLQDLRGPSYSEHAETLGLLEWANFLQARNLNVRNLLRQRDNETADKTDVVVKEARATLHNAYCELTARIEAFILLGDGAPENLETAANFVEVINVVIDRFDRLIKRRKGKRPGGGGQGGEQEEGEEQENGQEGGSEE